MGDCPLMKAIAITLSIIFLFSAVAVDVQGTSEDGLKFDMIIPNGESEGFVLMNASFSFVDLRDYYVSDGEGTIVFEESIILGPGEKIAILSSDAEEWLCLDYWMIYGTNGIVCDGFKLADDGDQLFLYNNGQCIDFFEYGADVGFKIGKKKVAIRNKGFGLPYDEDEWKIHIPGRTLYHHNKTFNDCIVTPFLFPDSKGEPILQKLSEAKESIIISMYTFDDSDIAYMLKRKADAGVDVKLLLEGSPAGGISSKELGILKSLSQAGVEVMIIKSNDSYKRFSYLHTKYAVVDSKTTIITSENWTESSMKYNRGWGIIIESEALSQYVKNIFYADFNGLDIFGFDELYPTATPIPLFGKDPSDTVYESFVADVSPVISPDYSYETLMSFISSTEYRLYVQQLNIQYSWTLENGLLNYIETLDADVRIQVDVTYDDPYDNDIEDGYGLFEQYKNSSIQFRYSILDSMLHNKGIISDDKVWIGSMNWTDSSVWDNREMSVIVHSNEVSNYFSYAFLNDWGIEYDGEVILNAEWYVNDEGAVSFNASSSKAPFGTEFRWDMDSDGEYERKGLETTWYSPSENCVLMAITPEGDVYYLQFQVNYGTNSDKQLSLLKYVPAVALVIMIIVLKRIKGKR